MLRCGTLQFNEMMNKLDPNDDDSDSDREKSSAAKNQPVQGEYSCDVCKDFNKYLALECNQLDTTVVWLLYKRYLLADNVYL